MTKWGIYSPKRCFEKCLFVHSICQWWWPKLFCDQHSSNFFFCVLPNQENLRGLERHQFWFSVFSLIIFSLHKLWLFCTIKLL